MAVLDSDFVAPGDPERTKRILELVGDVTGKHVLDLACRTGVFALALARAGAYSLGIEGRVQNFGQIPEQERATFRLGDVRDMRAIISDVDPTREAFDITLCMGILYHLGPEDAFKLLKDMRAVTAYDGKAIIDTHVGSPLDAVMIDGAMYHGNWYGEPPGMWSSIGNDASFWFDPESLRKLILDAGWNHVREVDGPDWPESPGGRQWLVLSDESRGVLL